MREPVLQRLDLQRLFLPRCQGMGFKDNYVHTDSSLEYQWFGKHREVEAIDENNPLSQHQKSQ